jgi:predicted HTH transcriptional regulator
MKNPKRESVRESLKDILQGVAILHYSVDEGVDKLLTIVNREREKAVKDCACRKMTLKQEDIYNYILIYHSNYKGAPTLQQVASNFNLSIPTIHQQINALVKKGHLMKVNGRYLPVSLKEEETG